MQLVAPLAKMLWRTPADALLGTTQLLKTINFETCLYKCLPKILKKLHNSRQQVKNIERTSNKTNEIR